MARATSAVAALLLIILGLGVAGAAYADPGNGNGNDGTSPGNAYGADNGNGSDNGNGNGAAASGAAAAVGASAATGGASTGSSGKSAAASSAGKSAPAKGSSAKSNSEKSSSAKGNSAKGSSTKGASDHQTHGTAGTSGTPPAPQPNSGADDNTGGANGQCGSGVYCGTPRDHASGNGNGGGKAVGKPCAGCVGKADNKNPPGQQPGPQDHNNGYECDGNHGIARTNPAHTGCQPGTPPCVGAGCPPPPGCVGVECTPPPPACVGDDCTPLVCPEDATLVDGACVFGEDLLLCPDGSVMPANGKCDKPREPTVLGEEAFRPPVKVKGAQAAVLPATGSSSGLGLFAGAGFTLLALGAGVMLRRRTA